MDTHDISTIEQFWNEAASSRFQLQGKHYYEAFYFGNTESSANSLAVLVLQGQKTATSSLLWTLEQENRPMLQVGDYSIVTTWDKVPVCIVETIELRILPFKDVDAQFAYDYGEGDRTFAWWKKHIWDYYVQECAAIGRQATEDMPILCERLRVVYPKER
jgi:uncharacterized protein YhfF